MMPQVIFSGYCRAWWPWRQRCPDSTWLRSWSGSWPEVHVDAVNDQGKWVCIKIFKLFDRNSNPLVFSISFLGLPNCVCACVFVCPHIFTVNSKETIFCFFVSASFCTLSTPWVIISNTVSGHNLCPNPWPSTKASICPIWKRCDLMPWFYCSWPVWN